MNAIEFQRKVNALGCFYLTVTKGLAVDSSKVVISTQKQLGNAHFKAIAKLGRYTNRKFELTICEEKYRPYPAFEDVYAVLEKAAKSKESTAALKAKRSSERPTKLTEDEVIDIYGWPGAHR
jgi:hypothetical protein